MIPCEFDLTSISFHDQINPTRKINLPPVGKRIGFNLLDDKYFTTTYVIGTIINSPANPKIMT